MAFSFRGFFLILPALCSFSVIANGQNLRPAQAQQAQQSIKAQQASGTVSSYDDTKGYGFIAPDDGSAAVFVHVSALERAGLGTLRAGQKITYTVVLDRRTGKFSADELHLVSAP
jgi:CspA family cold shock protein